MSEKVSFVGDNLYLEGISGEYLCQKCRHFDSELWHRGKKERRNMVVWGARCCRSNGIASMTIISCTNYEETTNDEGKNH